MNELVISNVIAKSPDVSLLTLVGLVDKFSLNFLLDSGASCNFISYEQLMQLDIEHDLVKS